jgi:hypothetical protein
MLYLKEACSAASKISLSSRTLLAAIAYLVLISPVLASGDTDVGIKIHGDWTITVTNADGSIAKEKVFQNSTQTAGRVFLKLLLIGEAKINVRANDAPAWDLTVETTGVNDLPECNERTISTSFPHQTSATNAVVSTELETFSLTRSFSLSANCIAGSDFGITKVTSRASEVFLDPYQVATGTFSSKTLTNPVTGILPDQYVTLKVTYSFQ